MIFYKNFLGIILIIGLILSISPITAYSIETKNNDNCNMNVLTQKTPKETTIGNVNTKLNYTNNSNGSSPSLSSGICGSYYISDGTFKWLLHFIGTIMEIGGMTIMLYKLPTCSNLTLTFLLFIPGFLLTAVY